MLVLLSEIAETRGDAAKPEGLARVEYTISYLAYCVQGHKLLLLLWTIISELGIDTPNEWKKHRK